MSPCRFSVVEHTKERRGQYTELHRDSCMRWFATPPNGDGEEIHATHDAIRF